MARKSKFSSPALHLALTDELAERAIKSSSGGCLIADAIKEQYPHLSNISVDMATVRVTDRKKGERYIYLTPPAAQQAVMWFDQGWPNTVEEVTVKGAVKIQPVTRGGTPSQKPEARAARRAELQARLDAGETLTKYERGALTRLTRNPDRPRLAPAAEVGQHRGRTVVRGGQPIMDDRRHPNPNLLRGRNRHFGAKLADPGEAFRQAVDNALAERLAEAQPS
jgi:hypothetical protein